jgi:hypothetical protein
VSAPDESVWFISRDGQRVGPLTAEEFAQFDETNRLRPTDQVWHAGMPGWIAYRDYAMREAAARFANPARPSSSARTSRPHALANTLQGTLRRVASRLAGLRTVFIRTRDEDGASAKEGRPNTLARLAPDLDEPNPASALRAQDASSRPLPTTLVQGSGEGILQSGERPNLTAPSDTAVHITQPLQRPAPLQRLDGREMNTGLPQLATTLVQSDAADIPGLGEPRKQDQNRWAVADASGETSEHPTEPVLCSSPIPRLANEAKAAAHIGLEIAAFRAWVADGRLPRPLPHCDKYDLKAIHLALDRMSRIGSPESGSRERLYRRATDRD